MRKRESHSSVKTWQRCGKRYYYQYVERLNEKTRPAHLQRGSDLHGLLEALHTGDEAPFHEAEAADLELIERYITKWQDEPEWEVIEAEPEYECTIGEYTVVFKPDLIVKISGEYWIVDHKTTANIPDEWDPYNMSDFQHLLYVYGMRQNGIDVKGFVFNYLRTKAPTQPKQNKDGSVGNVRAIDTTYDILKAFAEETGNDGHPDVVDKLQILKITPDRYFQRHYLLVPDAAIRNATADIHAALQQIEFAWETESYPRNVISKGGGYLACGKCPFQALCHADLLGINRDVVLLDYIARP